VGAYAFAEDETTGVDFTQHAETAYAEGVHGHQPLRRPSLLGELGAPRPPPRPAEGTES
jgi:Amt family ammonium transporter